MTANKTPAPSRTHGTTPGTSGDPARAPVAEGVPWILLVEDNKDLQELGSRALAAVAPGAQVTLASNGKQALAQLAEASTRSPSRRPDLILLDLKLPGMDGTGVLEQMRADPAYLDVPVVVLSSCRSLEDIRRAYDAGANSYVPKPVEFTELKDVIERIAGYWLTTNLNTDPAQA